MFLVFLVGVGNVHVETHIHISAKVLAVISFVIWYTGVHLTVWDFASEVYQDVLSGQYFRFGLRSRAPPS